MDVKKGLVLVAKYLAHGALFSILVYFVGLLWIYLTGFLLITGALLGLILAFVVLMAVWGFLNSLIAKLLWFPVEKGWKVWLGQGLALVLSLGVVNGAILLILLPFLLRLDYVVFITVLVGVEVLYAFIDGFIAMHVARHWKLRGVGVKLAEEGISWTPEAEILPNNPKSLHCPRCGSTKLVVARDNSALCLACNKGIRAERMGGATG